MRGGLAYGRRHIQNHLTRTPITETIVRPKAKRDTRNQRLVKVRRQLQYHVMLLNYDDHTSTYVIESCRKLFGYSEEEGLAIAKEVHMHERCIVWIGTLEVAEFNREQIHTLDRDSLV